MYKHRASKTNIGLNFRSAVTHHLSGEASFAFGTNYTLGPFVDPQLLQKAFPQQPVKGSFTTPGNYGIGIANSKFWNSTISFDFRFQDFDRFANVSLNFSETQQTNPDVRTPAEKRLIFNFRNSYQTAVGFEKRLGTKTQLRTGYMFDSSPVIDASVGPLFPDANRHSITAGATHTRGHTEFSLFYEALIFVDRVTNVPANNYQWTNGDYHNFAHVAGAGMRFNLKGSPSSEQ